MEHQKHEKLTLKEQGEFHPSEIGLIGTGCEFIRDFSFKLKSKLNPDWIVPYVDAVHEKKEEKYDSVLMDMVDHWQFISKEKPSLEDAHLVLVNSNHFDARHQIVFIDPDKRESLRKRLGRLTAPLFFILRKGETEIFDFLEKFQNVPVFNEYDFDGILAAFEKFLDSKTPPLFGVVLAGGESRRMGKDKGLLQIHGKPQREWLLDLIRPMCEKVFLSVKNEIKDFDTPIIKDSFLELGPLGAILSAFRQNPNVAWLVIATDLPLLDKESLNQLVNARDVSAHVTAFFSAEKGFPEPLIAIYEPRAYPLLLKGLSKGLSCPRKAIKAGKIKMVEAMNPDTLLNVNDPATLEEVFKKLH